jgi:hypothetical protein
MEVGRVVIGWVGWLMTKGGNAARTSQLGGFWPDMAASPDSHNTLLFDIFCLLKSILPLFVNPHSLYSVNTIKYTLFFSLKVLLVISSAENYHKIHNYKDENPTSQHTLSANEPASPAADVSQK